jgi:3-keto-5-aminohexanoate cleavage enzyme
VLNAAEARRLGQPVEVRMSTACIISVAITGSLPRKKDNPAIPISVSEQVESTHAAYEAGATLVHLHVRNDDQTPTSAPERFARVLEGIRTHCSDIITQVSTGGRSGAGQERGGMLHLRPDMASLSSGSVNFPTRVYDNPPELVDWLASEMVKYDVKPEIEAFDLSMIFQAVAMERAGKIKGPLHLQFIMGIKNAMPVDREVFEFYVKTVRRIAPEATWTGAGIGRGQLTLARWSLELGGHCRTGLEDNVRLDKQTLAPSNAALVNQVAELCGEYGRHVATPREARELLQLAAAPQVLPGNVRTLEGLLQY